MERSVGFDRWTEPGLGLLVIVDVNATAVAVATGTAIAVTSIDSAAAVGGKTAAGVGHAPVA